MTTPKRMRVYKIDSVTAGTIYAIGDGRGDAKRTPGRACLMTHAEVARLIDAGSWRGPVSRVHVARVDDHVRRIKKQKAREALHTVRKICALTRGGAVGDWLELFAAVAALDLYLTGRDEARGDGDVRPAQDAALGAQWIVYLSDGGYTRMIIDPQNERRPVRLAYGGESPHPGFKRARSRFHGITTEKGTA